MVVNLSVDTSSVDLMELAKDLDAFYIDTVVEPWPGLYTDQGRSISERSNYALREGILDAAPPPAGRRHRRKLLRRQSGNGVVDGQAGPARHRARPRHRSCEPHSREHWARLMRRVGVKGIHIAERDTQRATRQNRAAISSIHGPSKASSRRPAALRARLGHAREVAAARRHTITISAATRRST